MKVIALLLGLLLAASPAIGWKDLSCLGPMQATTFKVPDSCADACPPNLLARKLREFGASNIEYYRHEYAKFQNGEAFAYPGLELCRTNEWACAHQFNLTVECLGNGGLGWMMEKTPGAPGSWLKIAPLPQSDGTYFPGLFTAAYKVYDPRPAPLFKRTERPRGGYVEQTRRMIEECSVKGIIETEVVRDVGEGPDHAVVVTGRQSLKGFLYAAGLSAMVDYTEVYPYAMTFAEVEGLLRGFVAVHAEDGRKLMELCAEAPAKP